MTCAHLLATLLRTVPERTAAHELRQHVVCLYMRVCVGYVWCMRLRTGPERTRVQTIPTHLMAEKKLHRQAGKGSGRARVMPAPNRPPGHREAAFPIVGGPGSTNAHSLHCNPQGARKDNLTNEPWARRG